MKVKTVTKVLAIVFLTVVLALTACAGFEKTRTYEENFADVAASSWYAKDVAAAYELGFVEGSGENTYSPNNSVSVAEGVTMACRVHAEYNGNKIPASSGGKWYDAYVDYAKKNGIIKGEGFDNYTREIKRYELAVLFHDAMGKDYFTKINDVVFIPDVPLGAFYWDKLITLYNAGVVMGNDEYGSFNPDANIKRSECAAIIGRVALPENRVKKELKPFTSENAYVLCYNVGMGGSKEDINSGWVYDNRGGVAKKDNGGASAVGDVSEKYGACYIREFNFIPKGEIVLETVIGAVDDGAFVEYRDIEENSVYMLKIVDGKWNVLTETGYKSTGIKGGNTSLRVIVDLDNGKSTTYINGNNAGTYDLLSDNVLSYRVGMDEKGIGTVSVQQVNMVVNYGIYENFDIFGIDEVYGWKKTGIVSRGSNQINFTKNSSLEKSFEALSGKVCAETYFLTPTGGDFTFELGKILTVASKDGKLVAGGEELYNLPKNMWHRLRVEADINNGKADVLLNGRSVGIVDLCTKEDVSSVKFKADGILSIDNIHIFEMHEYSDYVPEPEVKANMDDYIVGLNICSLWRNGTHYGWACISAFDEPVPVIGMYDEGTPESADWEIKYMVEHGIDFQAFCWYAETNSGPIKYPSNCEQLHNGYMYAEYSDYMKYCLLWEAANAAHFKSTFFRQHVVPYWFENYFLDPRYMTIDNKLVLPIFGTWHLATEEYFGSVVGVRKEFEYLEQKAREYGFDGFIFLSTGTSTDQLASMGFDGAYAYNWGNAGKKYEHNVNSILGSAKNQLMYTIPTISVGFDSVPWHHERYGNMTVEDFAKSQEWVKNEYLPEYSDKYDWADRLVWMSTWNEYGEGTYIMPSGLNGFGYVDVIRDAYTNLPHEHEDVVPTLRQKERITHLYPQYAKLLRCSGWYYYERDKEVAAGEAQNRLYVNDVDILANTEDVFAIPPVTSMGRTLFPFNPSTGVSFILGCHYEYRKDAGTLRIVANGHEVMFEIGSDVYMKDGKEEILGYAPGIFDGLVMLDFEKLGKDLGYKTSTKDGNVYIYTDTYESLWKVLADRKVGAWEFNQPYDNEGFASSHMTLVTNNGSMKMTTIGTTNDPISFYMRDSFPEDFYTKKFTAVEVRCRYKYTTPGGSKSNLSFYYITDRDSTYDENKNLRLWFNDLDSNGEWVTLRMDLLDQNNWQSAERLTGLRFDPFNGQGEIEIDYIRFIEDPDFVYIPPEERPLEIINGDAESNIEAYYSDNAEIKRVEDPDKAGNHVWQVKARPGTLYTYFRHGVRYKPYTAYKIEFDIKLIGNNGTTPNVPDKTSFNINMRYSEKGALNDFDHVVRETSNTAISLSDGWIHCEAKFNTGRIDSHEKSEFTVYMNPNDNTGFSFMIDNISVTEREDVKVKIPLSETFTWAKTEGKMLLDFEKQEKVQISEAKVHRVENGLLYLEVEKGKYDIKFYPEITPFGANEYSAVAVRFKAEKVEVENPMFQVFFGTDSEPDHSESKSAKCGYSGLTPDKDGFMTAVLDFSDVAEWKGKIVSLRFDPANSAGIYYIDKVMLVK